MLRRSLFALPLSFLLPKVAFAGSSNPKLAELFDSVDKILCNSFRKATNGLVCTLHGCDIDFEREFEYNDHPCSRVIIRWDGRKCDRINAVWGNSIEFDRLSDKDFVEFKNMFLEKYRLDLPETSDEVADIMAKIPHPNTTNIVQFIRKVAL